MPRVCEAELYHEFGDDFRCRGDFLERLRLKFSGGEGRIVGFERTIWSKTELWREGLKIG